MSSRPPPRRGPSGAWSRLRTAAVDPLTTYGLPSKGETRLSDPKTQEAYFETIVSRYMKFCAACGTGEKLDQVFASLSLDESSSTSTKSADSSSPNTNEIPIIFSAMRKLREAIVSTQRTDAFAQRVYIFITRTTIHPFGHYESYSPSLLYLLQKIHPATPLPLTELHEFVSYLILDLACRQGDLHEAFRVRKRHGVKDWKVDRCLKALVADDWVAFWRVRRQVDGACRVLMGWKEAEVRRHALAALGRAYLSADRVFVEKSADREWSLLVKEDRVGWELDGTTGVVTIRRIRPK